MRSFLVGFVCILVLGGGIFAWKERGIVRDRIEIMNKPTLPPAVAFVDTVASSTTTSTTTTIKIKEVNLAVSFLSQAPAQNWDVIHEDTCEEASILMVKGFYENQRAPLSSVDGETALMSLVNKEKVLFGKFESTTAEETLTLAKSVFGMSGIVKKLQSSDDLKRELDRGHPVILPTSGKDLHNPNFKNGGPLYHMVVVKGYLPDGRWITNDPGTRKGADYLYAKNVLFNAVHDWNGGDVTHGEKRMLILLPGKK